MDWKKVRVVFTVANIRVQFTKDLTVPNDSYRVAVFVSDRPVGSAVMSGQGVPSMEHATFFYEQIVKKGGR